MRKANTASISVIASVVSAFVFLIRPAWAAPADQGDAYPIQKVFLKIDGVRNRNEQAPYRLLLDVREGDVYNRQNIRISIDNLFKTDSFDNIEVRMQKNPDASVNLHFVLFRKKFIHMLYFSPVKGVKPKELKNSLFSLKKNTAFEESQVKKALEKLREFLRVKGYFQPQVEYKIEPAREKHGIDIHFTIHAGERTKMRRLTVSVNNPQMKKLILPLFRRTDFYVPAEMQKLQQKMTKLLQRHNFFFPEIAVQDLLVAAATPQVDVTVRVDCGFKYVFDFVGMPRKVDLIRAVWEKKVFEKWAEDESRARIVNYLSNAGYIHARIQSQVIVKERNKHVIFSVVKDRRYKMGKVLFQGNEHVPEAKLREIVQSDDLFFEKVFWLRGSSLLADLELLRLYYYYQGFLNAKVNVEPQFHAKSADILFRITENQAYQVAAVLFFGNHAFSPEKLQEQMKTKPGGPFVQKQIGEDIYRLQNFYWNNGYADAAVSFDISEGNLRILAIRIDEGMRQRMGDFIIIGGSEIQRGLIRKLFPLKKGDLISREKIDSFQSELESSALFSEVRVESLRPIPGVTNIFVKVTPDRSRSYGFGLGWVERKDVGLRGTLEYQERNIFNSISTFSCMLQLTLSEYFKVDPFESRGIIAIDTPFFLENKIHSTFNVWVENEIFPSYRYNRYGVGASFIKYFSDRVYAVGSLKWYRTRLTELNIPPYRVDQLGTWFDTTAFTFSLARDNRDDPFNPSSGHFVSADLKIGLPIFEKDYTFLKFFWNYQWHSLFLKNVVFSLSFRNGFGFGDMSISERFFAGGSHSFRGTRNDRLGPLYYDPVKNEEWPMGGNVLVLLNLEATFPLVLVPIKNLYYSIFADIGNVFEKSSQLDFGILEKAVGIALKYRTPMGPIRLGVAYNLRPLFKPHFSFHLGIGNVY